MVQIQPSIDFPLCLTFWGILRNCNCIPGRASRVRLQAHPVLLLRFQPIPKRSWRIFSQAVRASPAIGQSITSSMSRQWGVLHQGGTTHCRPRLPLAGGVCTDNEATESQRSWDVHQVEQNWNCHFFRNQCLVYISKILILGCSQNK